MLTYVINTSENRTLDSDRLFDLTGYNKIRWMNCPLTEIGECAKNIYEKQNILGADEFRIAVLVDFYSFDRIRQPYRRNGYKPETGVDIGIYLPYIEVYLLDNLIEYLANREIRASDFEVYYVQNTKLERYEFVNDAKKQLAEILEGNPDEKADGFDEFEETVELTDEETGSEDGDAMPKKASKVTVKEQRYSSFSLHCSPSSSLTFKLSDYPYGDESMGFTRFFSAFSERVGEKYDIRRHYYISNYGGGPARAAFDTLTLSLYLIRMYEREENTLTDGEIEIGHIEAEDLKDVLISAWNKINIAYDISSKGSNAKYYSLSENSHIDSDSFAPRENSETDILKTDDIDKIETMDPKKMYEQVRYYSDRTREQLAADKRAELDRLMREYLGHRDQMRELDVKMELEQNMREGALVMTTQFPSEEDYNLIVRRKEEEISIRFNNVLHAAFRKMDFTEEKERVTAAYEDYTAAKKCLHRSIVGDLIFMLLALMASVGPYAILQLTKFNIKFLEALILGTQTLALFFALFVLAVIIQFTIISIKLIKAKNEIKNVYYDAHRKECDSMVQLRMRYREDLIFIERTRYELRLLKYLYECNLKKDENIRRHRDLLEELDDHLGSMLNYLDVEPVRDNEGSVSGIFDITKPIRSRENSIYRIFSLETIEKLFSKKGRDKT